MKLINKTQQCKENKLNPELQEKRHDYYLIIKKVFHQINHGITIEQLENFNKNSSEYLLLFDKDIMNYFEELLLMAKDFKLLSEDLNIDALKKKYHNLYNYEKHNIKVSKFDKVNSWFTYEFNNVEHRFRKYLDFNY